MFSFFKKKKKDEPLQEIQEIEESANTLPPADSVEDSAAQDSGSLKTQDAQSVAESAAEMPAAPPHNAETFSGSLDTAADNSAAQDSGSLKIQDAQSVAESAAEIPAAPPHNAETFSGSLDTAADSSAAQDSGSLKNQDAQEKPQKSGWLSRLKKGLGKSRDKLGKSLAGVFGGGQIDEELYEDLESVLLTADMGIDATEHLLKDVRRRVSLRGLKDAAELKSALKDALYDLLLPLEQPLELPENTAAPFVIMMAGVNGAGKTTSIGKLAKYFQNGGKSVLLAAGDTFRAAAREQLIEWGQRNQVAVISQTQGDSAAVCFDALEAARARKIDVVLADTAGRLPTQLHLMEEIKKVKRVMKKAQADAPQEIFLVLDANIGQNAVNQVVAFDDALGLTGLILTKLDGTAKGGVIAALAKNRPVPVRYIGVGEGIDDLRPFRAREFVDALLD